MNKTKEKKLKKNQIIETEGKRFQHKFWKVVCVDEEYAVFAYSNKTGTKVKLTELFIISPKYIYSEEDNSCDSNNFMFKILI